MKAWIPFVSTLCLALAQVPALDVAAQDWAVSQLAASPRHHEWVEVPAAGERTVRSFVAYPERADGALAVIVLHENRGLTDWVRSFADQLAGAGYLAIAPDLLSGFDAERPHTGAFADSDAAREAIYALDADQVTGDLLAVQRYVAALPGASGETAVVGFCWGGAQAFRFASHSPDLAAALVFYGTAPEDEERIAAISAPVHGFYGENDERVNATIEPTRRRMAAHGKTYTVEIYPGAGHAFMRQADDPQGPEAAKEAKRQAWGRMEELLSGIGGAPSLAARLDDYLGRLERLGAAGAALVATGDEVVLAKGYGLADRGRRTPWTTATVSSIGSITKPFTATAVMRLVAAGELSTDDPIGRFFADVPADKRGITVHHLLTHTSGLVGGVGGDFEMIGRDEIVAAALAEPLDSAPGETYSYSNVGYSLLGAIVEKVSGRPYEELLRSEVLVPAGLFETGYRLPGYELARVARGYRGGEEWGTVLERPWLEDGPSWNLRANGGLHSTIFDVLRWVRALDDGRLLPPEVAARMFTAAADEGGGTSYGYGWGVGETDRGTRVVGHSGGNGILFSDLRWYQEEDVVVFMLTNVAEYPAEEITPALAAIVFDEPVAMPPVVVAVEAGRLAALAGTYRLAGGGELVVEAEDGRLAIEPKDARTLVALWEPGAARDAAATERRRSADRRTDEILRGILAGDYRPVTAAYGDAYTLEYLSEVYSQRIGRLVSEMGPVEGHAVLGTAADSTTFRIDFRDGTFWGRYLWDGDSLRGLDLPGGPPRLEVHPTATAPTIELQAFALGSDLATRISFDGEGRMLIRGGGGGEPLVATRAGGG